MWKPTNPPNATPTPNPEPPRSYTPPAPEPPIVSRPVASSVATPQEQATLGKSLVIKGEVTGSESLYIDGRVEGSTIFPATASRSAAMAWSRPTFRTAKSWCWAKFAAI